MKRSVDSMLPSYFELVQSLLHGCLGLCVLDSQLQDCGSRGELDCADFSRWVQKHPAAASELNLARRLAPDRFQVALGIADSTSTLTAVLGIAFDTTAARALGSKPAQRLRQRLKPVLDVLHREIGSAARALQVAAQAAAVQAPRQSQNDAATGLLTRAALEEAYRAIPDSSKNGPRTALQIDIDRLHVINSTHGFVAGDDVVVRMAGLLAPPILPREALVARIAGDQFVVVLLDCDTTTAASLASQLQQAIARVPCEGIANGIEVTLSCGIASLNDNAPGSLAAALVSAETACKAAKEHGRNRVETFACDDSSLIGRQKDVRQLRSLEEALRNDRFELFVQPITPLSDPELPGGYEVLLRLRNPDNTIGSPAEFLSAAHRYQMMPSIDRWVLDHTLKMLEEYSGVLLRRRVSISINVTGHSLADEVFVNYLLSQTQGSRFPPRLLNVEITEQSAVRHPARAVHLMNKLRAAGCGVALDDFGTGTNSLVYLRDFPVTRVKIDGSFVKSIATDRKAETTLRGIVELVKPFDVDTVAEYVESGAIAQKVRMLGIDYAQGYAFGRPEPMTQVFRALQDEESRKMHRLALEI